jgi:hypothetical protein
MTPDIAKRLTLVFPTAALQEPGVTGVAGVAEVTRYAQKPPELRQLRPLRHENDNAGKMPDAGVAAHVAAPVAADLWLDRNPMRSAPDRCLHCGGAEHAHDPLLPFGTESTGHAWLHSRCWSAWYSARRAEAAAAL